MARRGVELSPGTERWGVEWSGNVAFHTAFRDEALVVFFFIQRSQRCQKTDPGHRASGAPTEPSGVSGSRDRSGCVFRKSLF